MNYKDILKIPFFKNRGYQDLIDIRNAPFTSKMDYIQSFPNEWITDEVKSDIRNNLCETAFTSGTTSNRMQLVRKTGWWLEEYKRMSCVNSYLIEHYGENSKEKKAILTTASCSNLLCFIELPTLEERIKNGALYLNMSTSPFEWSEADVIRIITELNEYAPTYLDADPIYLAILIAKGRELGITINSPKCITLSYEFCPSVTRKYIQDFFKDALIISLFGATEYGYVFCECSEGEYHWCTEDMIIDFIPIENSPNFFELCVTSYKNQYMPFIRYLTGDIFLVEKKSDDKCLCGIKSKRMTATYLGRKKDYTMNFPLFQGEFDQIMTSSVLHLPVFLYSICIQNKEINISIITYKTCGVIDIDEIKKNIITKLSKHTKSLGQFCIHIHEVDSLEITSSGKFSLYNNLI